MKKLIDKNLKRLFFASFSFSMYLGITSYVNSSFIQEFGISDSALSLLYIIGSVVTIFGLLYIPAIIKKFGNYKVIMSLLIIMILTLIIFSFSSSIYLIIPLFVMYLGMRSFIVFETDLFVEHFTSKEGTGRVRGILMTVLNTGWLIAPALSGFFVDRFGLASVYVISIAFILFMIVIYAKHFRNYDDPKYPDRFSFTKTIHKVLDNKNLSSVFMVSAMLNFFYAMMVIYSPIYLHQTIGFSWQQIGFLLVLMHIPFVTLEYPVGRLADRKWGEQEMMTIGVLIMAAGAYFFSVPTEPHFITWMFILMGSRVGASLVESTTESYFFKQIEETDTDIISLQRDARPVGYILAPLVALIALNYITESELFIVLGIIVAIVGTIFALRLKDTK